jgi:SAM-dependent methyltransferase
MLRRCRERGLRVAQGDATAIPFAPESFDVVCSFKVLPHVQDLAAALAEMARLLRPGGVLLLEFYNRRSLRYLVKRTKRPTSVAEGVTDEEVFTRYDTLETFAAALPPGVRIAGSQDPHTRPRPSCTASRPPIFLPSSAVRLPRRYAVSCRWWCEGGGELAVRHCARSIGDTSSGRTALTAPAPWRSRGRPRE